MTFCHQKDDVSCRCRMFERLCRVEAAEGAMLRQQAPVTARALDLTVVGDSSGSSFYRIQQSAPASLTGSALLPSSSDTLCHNPRPPLSARELRLRSPYSFGPARSLEEAQSGSGYVYREWADEKRPCSRVVEQSRRHPAVVNFCQRSATADRGQSISFVIYKHRPEPYK